MQDDEEEDDRIPDWTQDDAFADDQIEETEEVSTNADDPLYNLGQVLRDAKEDCEKVKESKKFERMLEDHKKPLFPGCKEEQKKLGTTLEMLQWKAKHGLSDKGFDDLMMIMKDMLPEGNELPTSTYEAKKIVCPLGLEVQKIHACPNDCILYRGDEYANLEACPVCKAQRYKIPRDEAEGEVGSKKKKIPAKVMWYFPVIPRLKRLFRCKSNAKLMRWHKEERKQDDHIRHPADGSQWRLIDREFEDFAVDPRNIRFGLSTDGFNPFGEFSSGHSTWPVTLCMFNLPPWMCLKRKFIMMPIIIQGPKQPGNDIDVYLRPLIDDLQTLWKTEGVPVWDEDQQESFNLRALLFVTINDWPALGNLSGQSNKGYGACTHCLDDTCSVYLKHSKKVVYLGHRRFLPVKHPLRDVGKHFEGVGEKRKKPVHRGGKIVFSMVKDLKVVFGKGSGSVQVPKDAAGHAPMWKKKSIFWELPYWEFLKVRNAIDVMHVMKNFCVNLLGHLGVYGKTKDTIEARRDLKAMNQREGLHPEKRDNGNYLAPASYTLSKEEKQRMFDCLNSIKVPSGYSSNIQRIINMKEMKFLNLKAHDCHVLMTQLLPVALRGILPENVRLAITKVCAFLNQLSQKAILPETLVKMQNDVVQCLVSFEMIFPPSFFNIMTHLLVHLVEEIFTLGPVYLHNMFPFERLMSYFKKYVHNRARPEGSIAKGYATEEVIEFCVDFMDDMCPIGLPVSRHEGRLKGKGTLGKKSRMDMDAVLYDQAHYSVLHQSSHVAPYLEEHMSIVRAANEGKSEAWITRQHIDKFASWLWKKVRGDKNVDEILLWLARRPSITVDTFQGYEINGYTLYTRAQDKKSVNQNSGVRMDAVDHKGHVQTYYGVIEEIWELDYGALKVPLLKCKWVKNTGGGLTTDKFGMTIVDLNKVGYKDDPFVLANNVIQVFYVKDMSSKAPTKKGAANSIADEPKRHIVLPGKRKIIGVEDKTDISEDYDQFDDRPPFSVKIDPSIMLAQEDAPYLRQDHKQGTFMNRKVINVPLDI